VLDFGEVIGENYAYLILYALIPRNKLTHSPKTKLSCKNEIKYSAHTSKKYEKRIVFAIQRKMFRSVRFFARLSSRCSAINVRRQFGFSVRSFSAVNKVDLDSALDELILEYDGKKNNVAKEEDIVDLVNLLHGSNTVGSSFDGAHTAELVRKVSAKARLASLI
jgi:hypothetical protein